MMSYIPQFYANFSGFKKKEITLLIVKGNLVICMQSNKVKPTKHHNLPKHSKKIFLLSLHLKTLHFQALSLQLPLLNQLLRSSLHQLQYQVL